jgi:hypothetical protein
MPQRPTCPNTCPSAPHYSEINILQDKNPRPEKYKSFVLLYHSKNPSKSLLDPIKVEACSGVKVACIKTIRAAAPGLDCVALMSTTGRYRLNALCRELTTDAYNEVDKSGLQIMGSEGLTILCNDVTTRDEYTVYKSMIDRVTNRNETRLGMLLGNWTCEDWKKHIQEEEDREAAALHDTLSDDNAGDETTEPQPKRKASAPVSSEQILHNQQLILQNQQQILHNIQLVLQKQDTNASEHREDISSLKEIVKKADSNSIDAAFLTETLKETTVELKGVRKTMHAQAGKIGAATAKANKALKENARLSAERKTTVEHQEVIDTIWQAVSQANDDARRAEDRILSALNIKDHPRGDPTDNFPYNQYPDPLLKDYREALTEAYKEAPRFDLRKNMPPLQDFPEAAKSRYFHLCISLLLSTPLQFRDLDKSPSQHMRELVGLSGPIFHADVYEALRKSFVTEEKFFCELLSKQYVEDTTIDPMIQGDPFTIPEVRDVLLQY